jgi:UDP-glucuronate 4-epimerase
MANIMVTGAAGFIAFHTIQQLLTDGHFVTGIDRLSDYYDVELKHARLRQLTARPGFEFIQLNLADQAALSTVLAGHSFDCVVHMAAQPGVRVAEKHLPNYASDNLTAFVNTIEHCRRIHVGHLIFASSSSVYGANTKLPFAESDPVDHPISLYAATKRANELIAHAYAHQYQLPCTGLRLFSVYGPWGRPDMAYFAFARAIVEGRPLQLFNHGVHCRDMTYVDDVVGAITQLLDKPPRKAQDAWPDSAPAHSQAPFQLLNVGTHESVSLTQIVSALEAGLGRRAQVELVDDAMGDLLNTRADIEELSRVIDFSTHTLFETGITRFIDWFRRYYDV